MSTKTCAPDELGLYWHQDTVLQAEADSPEIIYEGSDDEYYASPEARQQACIAAGYRYLQGRPPVLLSTTLHGPFDSRSGWRNPWGSRTQALSQKATYKQASKKNHSDRHTAQGNPTKSARKLSQPGHSQESHLPSPESLKQASAASTPHRWDDDELVYTETWVNGICEGDLIGGTKSRESSATRKRKSKRSESAKADMAKRKKTGQDHSGQHTSSIHRTGSYSLTQPPRRGCRAAFDDPITLSFASAPGQIESHSSQPASEYHKLARSLRRTKSSQPLFLSIPQTQKPHTLTSPPKRSCPTRIVKKEQCDDAESWNHALGMPSPSSPCSDDIALDTDQTITMPLIKQVMCGPEPSFDHTKSSSSTRKHDGNHQTQQDERQILEDSPSDMTQPLAGGYPTLSEPDIEMDDSSEIAEANRGERLEASRCQPEAEEVTSDHAIIEGSPRGSDEADVLTSTEDDTSKAEVGPQPSLPALPSSSMSLDQSQEDDYDQTAVDAMVLDQLTQSTYAHVSMRDAPSDLNSTNGAEDISMRATEITKQLQDEALARSSEDDRTMDLEGGMSEGDTFAVSSDELRQAAEANKVDRATSGEHLILGASGDMPHFSFATLVSKIVPTNSCDVKGTSHGSELYDGDNASRSAANVDAKADVQPNVSQPVASCTSADAEAGMIPQEQGKIVPATEETSSAQVEPRGPGPEVQAQEGQLQEIHPEVERAPSPSPHLTIEGDVVMTSATNLGAEVSDTPAEVKTKLIETIEVSPMADISMASVGQIAETLTTSRSKTPEPLFCIKSMASFMSPSPKQKPRRRPTKLSGGVGASTVAKSALKCPWAAPKARKQVTWAPLPDEDDSHGAQRLRQASPPPESTTDMATEHDAKFQQHFSAVSRRSRGRHQKRRLGSDEIQRLDCSPTADCEAHIPASESATVDVKSAETAAEFPATTEEEDVDMEREDSEEPMDIVEDVFQEMSQLLRTWDVDVEFEAARMQSSTAVLGA